MLFLQSRRLQKNLKNKGSLEFNFTQTRKYKQNKVDNIGKPKQHQQDVSQLTLNICPLRKTSLWITFSTTIIVKLFRSRVTYSIDNIAFKKKQMHSGRWGLSRETISLLYLRHNHFSCGIFFCLIPLPIPQCIAKNWNVISSITAFFLTSSYQLQFLQIPSQNLIWPKLV